ncbi:MAG TPA: hypothetical protein ENK02_01770 [Planctomycetes bacterium]|nr:hypothetical protein [Planctomycetota bacterium]
MTTAWLLNLDADLEYAWGEGYLRSPAMARRVSQWSDRVLGLLGPGDRLLPLEAGDGAESEWKGAQRIVCWSPTPSALARLRALGLTPPPAPDFGVLRRVNAKEWVSPLGLGLAGGRLLRGVGEALEVLGSGGPWRLKSRWGFAGRGQRSCPKTPGEADQRWIAARIQEDGGLWVEPEIEVLEAYALHGWLSREGELRCGRLLRQLLGPGGRWEGAEPARGARKPLLAMGEALERVGESLGEEGYFGPFGLDGIAWKRGEERGFCPLLECNARLTMAFGLGFSPGGIPEIP